MTLSQVALVVAGESGLLDHLASYAPDYDDFSAVVAVAVSDTDAVAAADADAE